MHRGSPEAVCYHVRITQDSVAPPDFSSKNDLTGNTYVLEIAALCFPNPFNLL